ncbi:MULTISPECIES: DUF1491 family protein [Sphingomonadales]|uniref:DUF1491 domain-containing protein n=2 Tax=Edaphosphingomonas TaxID=3423724 RepID=A0A2T4I8M0_9SPHN|nr:MULTISPECIES: DUF1491 family protein [Sphingomonas]AGH49774.1 hypothetical protein G432_10255 [Sphingomonas sp. MM-1]MDX3885772.1 DUF1491 family protein [Sphingomonas sp.]OHT18089.1 hypothetical protein BHE75_00058 [Sphingomonas haloaromaticamans]PTD28098.1 DUF1491 domain-containing protein [Sphingomonas fennica]
MTARLAAGVLVSALIRRVEATGGSGMVLARGDPVSGAILLVILDRGRTLAVLQRTLDAEGRYRWAETGPADPDAPGVLADYIARQRRFDPDLWAVELDGPDARAIADEMTGG